jgi:hypothetical protein
MTNLHQHIQGVAIALIVMIARAAQSQQSHGPGAGSLDHYRDSLVGAVPLDSLGKLDRAMLTATDPKPIAREIVCEELRLGHVHGAYIVSVAARRLRDSLYSRADRSAYERMDARLAGGSLPLRVSDCHIPTRVPKAADSLDIPPQARKP